MFKRESREFLSKHFILFLRPFLSLFHSRITSIFYFPIFFFLFTALSFICIVYSPEDLKTLPSVLKLDKPSVLYGINEKGKNEPIAEFYQISRNEIKLSELSKEQQNQPNKIVQSFITSEDRNFYSHLGVDTKGILRAFIINLLAGTIKEGASTITQQVARLKFLTRKRTYIRKIREIWLSFLLESYYKKETILEIYLNEVPLGHGNIGVGAAAKFYFDKGINELDWAESSLLASLTTRPSRLSPLAYPERSREKVKITLKKLIENGNIEVKTAEQNFQKLSKFFYGLNRSPNESAFSNRINRFPYFTEYIRKKISQFIPKHQLYNGGFKIFSTLKIKHQIAAEQALKEGLKKQNEISSKTQFKNIDIFHEEYGDIYRMISTLNQVPEFKFKISKKVRDFQYEYQNNMRDELFLSAFFSGNDLIQKLVDTNTVNQDLSPIFLPVEGTLISMEPNTGYITSLVGGSGFKSDNQQIRAFQAYRQPGSAFKPLIFATALDLSIEKPELNYNINPSSLFFDNPLLFFIEDGSEWRPTNYTSRYRGFIRFREALLQSVNTVSIQILDKIGLDNTIAKINEIFYLPKYRKIPRNYSLALGSFELSPFELTKLYTIFASQGKNILPKSILYITNSQGKKIEEFEKNNNKTKKEIFSPETSIIITSILEDVVKEGTGKKIFENGPIYSSVAGKTGTTNQYKDAWFVGFTPGIVATVWIGYDTGSLSLGSGMAGGVVAAPIWGNFIREALKNEPIRKFEFHSKKITKKYICAISGKLPDIGRCQNIIEEYFTPEIEPTQICQLHKGYNDNQTGLGLFQEDEDDIK